MWQIQVSVLVCTADVAMQAFCPMRQSTTQPTSLLKDSACSGLWHDDAQRVPLATTLAHVAHVPSLGFPGDQGQRVTLGDQITNQLSSWAEHLLLRIPWQRKPSGVAGSSNELRAPESNNLLHRQIL